MNVMSHICISSGLNILYNWHWPCILHKYAQVKFTFHCWAVQCVPMCPWNHHGIIGSMTRWLDMSWYVMICLVRLYVSPFVNFRKLSSFDLSMPSVLKLLPSLGDEHLDVLQSVTEAFAWPEWPDTCRYFHYFPLFSLGKTWDSRGVITLTNKSLGTTL